MKKTLSMILCFVMVLSAFSAASVSVNASETNDAEIGAQCDLEEAVGFVSSKTQDEAVSWLRQQNGAEYNFGDFQDDDGNWWLGTQCVEFVRAYVNWLVNGNTSVDAWNGPTGNGDTIWQNSIWSRLGWEVYYNSADFLPMPGDIFSSSGVHTGVVISSTVNTATVADSNAGNSSPYDGDPVWVHDISWQNAGSGKAYGVNYFIRPNFAHIHTYGSWQTVQAATCTTAGSKKRVCSTCGDTQTETIPATGHNWNNGVITTPPTCENNGVKTFTCSACNATRTEDVAALGHAYESVTVPANCTEAAYTRFTCSRCGHTYTEALDGWSEWSTTQPPAGAENPQQKTQYRYKTKETSTGTDPEKTGWTTDGETWKQTSTGTHAYFTRPSGFNESAYTNYASSGLSASSNATSKREVSSPSVKSYIFWHWAFPNTKGVGTNTYIGAYYGDPNGYSGYTATVWEAFESATDVTEEVHGGPTYQVQGHSEYSYNWFKTEVYQQTYTDYVKQYSYYRWSDWSAWQDDAVTANSDRQVEQRTVYRYLSDENNATGHQFGNTWKSDAENHWQECSVCGVESERENHVYDNAQDATCNICGYTRTVETDPQIDPDDAHLSIESKTARAGDTVTIAFELKNAPALKSVAISGITYDAAALELVTGEWKIADSILSNWNSANQTAVIAFAQNKEINGCIFELTFRIKDDAADGEYSIGCNITAKTKTSSGAEDPVTIPTQRGTISVISVIRGDVNGDNVVTSDDAIQVLYYTLLPEIYSVNQDVDFNGDGMVTSDDAVHLLYFTLLPDIYTLH